MNLPPIMVYSQILFLSSGGRASRREEVVGVVSVAEAMIVIMSFFAVVRVSTKPKISRGRCGER